MMKKLFIINIAIVLFFTITFGNVVLFAEENETSTGDPIEQEEQVLTEEQIEEIEENEEIEDKNVDKHSWKITKNESKKSSKEAKNEAKQAWKKEKDEAKKAWKEKKRKLEAQKGELESQKNNLEKQKKELKKQLREANKAKDLELIAEIRQKINELEKQIYEIKQQIKDCKLRIRKKIRESYDEEEIKAFEEVASRIKEKYKGIKVLPFDCVIARGRSLKFDTPPVIKDGRTLIPVRAISEGFEAKVVWNAEERTVTVTKGDKEMVLKVGSVVAYINGVETRLDVSAEILNGRTVIPLRFIIEGLGLRVEWDSETETIEIEDGEDTTGEEESEEDEGTTGEEESEEDEDTAEEESEEIEDTANEEETDEDGEDTADEEDAEEDEEVSEQE